MKYFVKFIVTLELIVLKLVHRLLILWAESCFVFFYFTFPKKEKIRYERGNLGVVEEDYLKPASLVGQ